MEGPTSGKSPEKADEKVSAGATRRDLFQIGNMFVLPAY